MRRVFACLCLCALCGCELIADFDRDKLTPPDAGSITSLTGKPPTTRPTEDGGDEADAGKR
jgi:hypothetical protein